MALVKALLMTMKKKSKKGRKFIALARLAEEKNSFFLMQNETNAHF